MPTIQEMIQLLLGRTADYRPGMNRRDFRKRLRLGINRATRVIHFCDQGGACSELTSEVSQLRKAAERTRTMRMGTLRSLAAH